MWVGVCLRMGTFGWWQGCGGCNGVISSKAVRRMRIGSHVFLVWNLDCPTRQPTPPPGNLFPSTLPDRPPTPPPRSRGQGEKDSRGARSKFEHTELKAVIDSSSVLALPVRALIYQDPMKV